MWVKYLNFLRHSGHRPYWRQANFLYTSLKYSYFMLKPHGFVVSTALLSLLWKKFPSDFFQSHLRRDRTPACVMQIRQGKRRLMWQLVTTWNYRRWLLKLKLNLYLKRLQLFLNLTLMSLCGKDCKWLCLFYLQNQRSTAEESSVQELNQGV